MRRNTNKTETIKEKIIGNLLEEPKIQSQLLTDLRLKKSQHANISKPLKALKDDGFIFETHVKSENIDDYCTKWSIVTDLNKLKALSKEYPGLFSKIQNSKFIRDSFILQVTIPILNTSSGEDNIVTIICEGESKEYLTEKLRLSPEFFEYFLNKSNENSQNNVIELAEFMEELGDNRCLDNEEDNVKFWKTYGKEYSKMGRFYLETVFEICVYVDVIKGQSSEEAKEYLRKMKRGEKKLTLPFPNL